jgi:formiminotetrahydrofolate cyclodeaminase
LLDDLASVRRGLAEAADEDTQVFTSYMAALAMPRSTEEEKNARTAALAREAEHAARVPLASAFRMTVGLERAAASSPLVKKGLLSDVLAGADLLHGAVLAALRNVDVNLPAIAVDRRDGVASERDGIETRARAAYERVNESARAR